MLPPWLRHITCQFFADISFIESMVKRVDHDAFCNDLTFVIFVRKCQFLGILFLLCPSVSSHLLLLCTLPLSPLSHLHSSSRLQIRSINYSSTFQAICFYLFLVLGLYLYILVVETFTRENIKLRMYIIIGWGKFINGIKGIKCAFLH